MKVTLLIVRRMKVDLYFVVIMKVDLELVVRVKVDLYIIRHNDTGLTFHTQRVILCA